jgi:phage shock protein C
MEGKPRNDILLIVGILVIVIGFMALGNTLGVFPPFVWTVLAMAGRSLGPLIVIALGVFVVLLANRTGAAPRMPAPGTRLVRSRDDRMVAGVAAGMAEYLGIDPLLVRLAWVIFGLASFGTALLAYIILAVLVPEGPNA